MNAVIRIRFEKYMEIVNSVRLKISELYFNGLKDWYTNSPGLIKVPDIIKRIYNLGIPKINGSLPNKLLTEINAIVDEVWMGINELKKPKNNWEQDDLEKLHDFAVEISRLKLVTDIELSNQDYEMFRRNIKIFAKSYNQIKKEKKKHD